jgi:DNA replication protein DnaC
METKIERRVCTTCGQEFDDEMTLMELPLRRLWVPHEDCPQCRAAKEEQRKRQDEEARTERKRETRAELPLKAQMPRDLRTETFENWLGESPALTVARQFADGFPLDEDPFGYRSLFLHSKRNGLGKSHLAGAIANRLFDRILERWDGDPDSSVSCPVLYHTGPHLLLRVRSSYNIRPDEAPWRETEAEVFDSLRGVPLLIIDDVGKEAGGIASEHTQKVYFHIVDDRYGAGLPLVMCSNLSLEELARFLGPKVGPAVVDRLLEMCQGRIIELLGESYRQRLARSREG